MQASLRLSTLYLGINLQSMCQIKEGTFKAKGTLKAKDSFKAKGIYNITPLNIHGPQCETLKPNTVREPKQKMNRKTNEHLIPSNLWLLTVWEQILSKKEMEK